MKRVGDKLVLEPQDVLTRFVVVEGVIGKDKKPRTREGYVKEVHGNVLVIAIWEGTATDDTKIKVDFEERRWKLMYPRTGEDR
jgi:hypothetical protein